MSYPREKEGAPAQYQPGAPGQLYNNAPPAYPGAPQPGAVPYNPAAPQPYNQGAPLQAYNPGAPQQYPPGYNPGAPQPVPIVLQPQIASPVVVQHFRDRPVQTTCPSCRNDVVTITDYEVGTLTWLIAGGICIVTGGTCCLCFIPFCINEAKDVKHICPSCNYQIGYYSRLN